MHHVARPDWGLRARMFVVMALLAALYLGFLSYLSARGVKFGFLIVIAAVMLGAQYFFSHKLAMWGMGAKLVTPEEAPELHAMVDRLARDAGIPKPQVAISKMQIPNAFATGRNPKNAVVAVTEGLMQRLEPHEVEAVLGHEIYHVINRDVAVMTLASFFAMVAFFLMRSFFFMGFFGGGDDDDDSGGGSIWVVYLVTFAVYLISQILILALGRYRELAADRGGANLTRRPKDLASALVKISEDVKHAPAAAKKQVETMNAFFIVPTSIKEIFSTHPSLERRLEQLEEISREIGKQ
ncbi:MAG: zinc metalloprotease HtpX [Actinomycetota bacterium]